MALCVLPPSSGVFILAVSWRYLRVISCSFPFASHHLLSLSPAPDCLSTGSGGGFQHKESRWWYKVTHRCRKTAYDGLTATEAGKGTFVAWHSKIRIMTGGEAPERESGMPLQLRAIVAADVYICICVCTHTNCIYV